MVSTLGVPYTRKPINVYSDGIRNIAAAMSRHEVKRLIVVSSSATEPHHQPTRFPDEPCPPAADHRDDRQDNLQRHAPHGGTRARQRPGVDDHAPVGPVRCARCDALRASRRSGAGHLHQPRRPRREHARTGDRPGSCARRSRSRHPTVPPRCSRCCAGRHSRQTDVRCGRRVRQDPPAVRMRAAPSRSSRSGRARSSRSAERAGSRPIWCVSTTVTPAWCSPARMRSSSIRAGSIRRGRRRADWPPCGPGPTPSLLRTLRAHAVMTHVFRLVTVRSETSPRASAPNRRYPDGWARLSVVA